MKLGDSFWIDLVACFGVGAAAAGTLVLAYLCSGVLSRSFAGAMTRNAISVLIYGLVMVAQISLLAFLGATRGLLFPTSAIGYVVGIVVALALSAILIRARSRSLSP